MQVVPRNRRNEFVLATVLEHLTQDGERVEVFDFARSDGDLKLHVRRWITRQPGDLLTNCRRHLAEISRRANTPGAASRIGVLQQLEMKRRIECAAADECPQRVQPRFALDARSSRGNEALILFGFRSEPPHPFPLPL